MYTFDHDLLLALNCDGGPAWDRFFWFMSGTFEWVPLYLLILYLIYRKLGWRRTLVAVGVMACVILVADQIPNFFKHYVPRNRPTHTPGIMEYVHTVNGYLGGRHGTVSAHAANAFAVAVYSLSLLQSRLYTVLILVWALLVCYSRIYLGVHFPMDLLWGAIDGTLVALAGIWAYRRIVPKIETFA